MLLIRCPHCGPRAEIEFRHAGEAHLVRPAPDAPEAAWTDYIYLRENPRGALRERWRHIQGCGRYFNAIRDTVSDRIAATYAIGAPAPAVEDAR